LSDRPRLKEDKALSDRSTVSAGHGLEDWEGDHVLWTDVVYSRAFFWGIESQAGISYGCWWYNYWNISGFYQFFLPKYHMDYN